MKHKPHQLRRFHRVAIAKWQRIVDVLEDAIEHGKVVRPSQTFHNFRVDEKKYGFGAIDCIYCRLTDSYCYKHGCVITIVKDRTCQDLAWRDFAGTMKKNQLKSASIHAKRILDLIIECDPMSVAGDPRLFNKGE